MLGFLLLLLLLRILGSHGVLLVLLLLELFHFSLRVGFQLSVLNGQLVTLVNQTVELRYRTPLWVKTLKGSV